MNTIFNIYMYIFSYGIEEGGKEKADVAIVAMQYNWLSGLECLKTSINFKNNHTIC